MEEAPVYGKRGTGTKEDNVYSQIESSLNKSNITMEDNNKASRPLPSLPLSIPHSASSISPSLGASQGIGSLSRPSESSNAESRRSKAGQAENNEKVFALKIDEFH